MEVEESSLALWGADADAAADADVDADVMMPTPPKREEAVAKPEDGRAATRALIASCERDVISILGERVGDGE